MDIPATADYRKVFERLFPPADRAEIRKKQERLALNRSILDTAMGNVRTSSASSDASIKSVSSNTFLRDVENGFSKRRQSLKMDVPSSMNPRFASKGGQEQLSGAR